ncbi:MAG: hypothetical protein OXF33_03115 [Rhodospirillales bacterium]|nr:hypothetical protein [Rhodospirillales bacterium]
MTDPSRAWQGIHPLVPKERKRYDHGTAGRSHPETPRLVLELARLLAGKSDRKPELVPRRLNQNLEHHYRVIRRTTAFRPVRVH